MVKNVYVSDNFEIDISEVSEIGEIANLNINRNSPMFCFIIGFKNGTFRNLCLHYSESNRDQIKRKAEKLHREIKEKIHGSEIPG